MPTDATFANLGIASWAVALGGWWLTYLVHSAILLTVAWVIASRLSSRFDAIKETCWRAALLAGVVTASTQAWVGWRPMTGSLVAIESTPVVVDVSHDQAITPNGSSGSNSTTSTNAADETVSHFGSDGDETKFAGVTGGDAHHQHAHDQHAHDALHSELTETRDASPPLDQGDPQAAATVAVSMSADRTSFNSRDLLGVVGIAFTILSLLGLARFVVQLGRTRRRLRRAEPCNDRVALTVLNDLCRAAGVRRLPRLVTHTGIDSPIAFGVCRPAIGLPADAVGRLSPQELRAVLAHELAHLVRRDPLWRCVGCAAGSLLWFQPMNHVARRRLDELAEYRCDQWAAGQTGDGLTMAGSLMRVAGWLSSSSTQSTPPLVAAMAVRQSPLGRRVRRLIEGQGGRQVALWRRAVVAALLILAVAVLAPVGMSASDGRAEAAGDQPVQREAIAVVGVVEASEDDELVEHIGGEGVDLAVEHLPGDHHEHDHETGSASTRDELRALDDDLASLVEAIEVTRRELSGRGDERDWWSGRLEGLRVRVESIRDRRAELERLLDAAE